MKLHRRACIALPLAALSGALHAQLEPTRVAVPFYRPADAMRGLYRTRQLPASDSFVAAAQALALALRTPGPNARTASRQAWVDALSAWEQLATVPLGPLIERRSLRSLDFQPARPALIERSIAQAPRGAAGMERVGAPAKGLPALEWLLWTKPATEQSSSYAAELGADLAREAQALRDAVAATAAGSWSAVAASDEADTPDAPRGDTGFVELLNQWVGALERLRWMQIDKPRREAATRGRAKAEHPRSASGQTAASWARQWQVLSALAIHGSGGAAAPGEGLVPFETYLRGRGQNPLAERWRQQVLRCGAALKGLRPEDSKARLDAAVRELAALKALAEAELAPAVEVSIGFSDADGD